MGSFFSSKDESPHLNPPPQGKEAKGPAEMQA